MKGKIYRLQWNTGHFYIGSTTTSLAERLGNHRRDSKTHTRKVYQHAREYGWETMTPTVVLEYSCETIDRLRQKEDELIRPELTNPLCLNERAAFQTDEDVAARQKAYREVNKEEVAAYKKAYYEVNREVLVARQKAYCESNREAHNARNKAYYEANREAVVARRKQAYDLKKDQTNSL